MLNNAREYADWRQQMLTTAPKNSADRAETMISRAIIELLATDQFYGELLTRLPRQATSTLAAPFALTWQQNRLILEYAPAALVQTFPRFDSLQAGLKHVALHVAWQHPLRYRDQVKSQQRLVTLATDLAVNQYVDGLPDGAVNLKVVQALVTKRLPAKADSGTYFRLLQAATTKNQAGPDDTSSKDPLNGVQPKSTNHSATTQPTEPVAAATNATTVNGQMEPQVVDDVRRWAGPAGQLTNPNLATARLQQLTRDAWAHTNEAGRGLVAGHVVASLPIQSAKPAVDWRRLVVRGLGQLPSGKRESHARFNRRQPARMELPGRVSDTRLNVQVYVDNSGSISDPTLQHLLAQVATLTRALSATITIKPFDAIVQPGQTYQAQLPQQVRFMRHGGGGTVFQSIFDDLAAHHLTNTTALVLILTDGRGERQIDSHRFTNVIWLLAAATDRLSVQPVVGKVVHLREEDQYDHAT